MVSGEDYQQPQILKFKTEHLVSAQGRGSITMLCLGKAVERPCGGVAVLMFCMAGFMHRVGQNNQDSLGDGINLGQVAAAAGLRFLGVSSSDT